MALKPDFAEAYHNLAAALAERGQFGPALDAARRAVGLTASHDAAMTNLANWHAFELEHPYAFAGMYLLWVRRRGG